MSKFIKFIFILVVVLLFISSCTYTFAAVDMNLNNANTSNTSNISNTSSTSSSGSSSSTLSSTVTTTDFDLELTNILSICLIVVGVLLVLLGIAILIRLKK